MDNNKPIPYIPAELLKTKRVEVYINDLQARLHQRKEPDNMLTECCEILKGIQDVSAHTITKQPNIDAIIQVFEELGKKNSTNDSVIKRTIIEKVGDVKIMRDKFEKIFQENFSEFVRGSVEDLHKIQSKIINENQKDKASELLTILESIYSLRNESNQNYEESICLGQEELEKDFD